MNTKFHKQRSSKIKGSTNIYERHFQYWVLSEFFFLTFEIAYWTPTCGKNPRRWDPLYPRHYWEDGVGYCYITVGHTPSLSRGYCITWLSDEVCTMDTQLDSRVQLFLRILPAGFVQNSFQLLSVFLFIPNKTLTKSYNLESIK